MELTDKWSLGFALTEPFTRLPGPPHQAVHGSDKALSVDIGRGTVKQAGSLRRKSRNRLKRA
jgi:hypothetical protein